MQLKRDEKDSITNKFIIKDSIINNNNIIINKDVSSIDDDENIL